MGRKKSELREILEEEGSGRYTLAERLIHHVTRAFSYVYISLVHGSFDHGYAEQLGIPYSFAKSLL